MMERKRDREKVHTMVVVLLLSLSWVNGCVCVAGKGDGEGSERECELCERESVCVRVDSGRRERRKEKGWGSATWQVERGGELRGNLKRGSGLGK